MGKEKTPLNLSHPRYVSTGVLGTGTYGHVLACVDQTTGEPIAVKVSHKENAYRRSALNEANLLATLNNSPNILKMKEMFEHDGRIHIAVEMLHMNLYELMRKRKFAITPLSHVREIGATVLRALGECHQAGFMHCDVKPENVMMKSPYSDTECCLIDFGAIRRPEENRYYDIQSLWYRAPEVICGIPYTPAIDVWSVGCMLFELHTGNPLFAGNDAQEQMALIVDLVGTPSVAAMQSGVNSTKLRFSGTAQRGMKRIEDMIVADPPEAEVFADLLYQMLAPDENVRAKVADCLKHPFFTGGTFVPPLRDQSFAGLSDGTGSTLNSPDCYRRCPTDDEHGLSLAAHSMTSNPHQHSVTDLVLHL